MSTAPRPVSASRTEMTELVLPLHANALGSVFGGQVMAWIDICGAIASMRHCQIPTVTAAIDELAFLQPIHIGEFVKLTGWVNAAFTKSVEVEVHVEVEDPKKPYDRRLCVRAWLTFVAVDSSGKPTAVPPLLCQSPDEKMREDAAKLRRDERLKRKQSTNM